ncbi:hypothetical protein DDB_G0278319 [Dictyostelium discoideum AX4]|uniref:Uncharacterized protein n=1 Tax=Dictyostelium discoideum TaxID=44689 RepID=Q54YB6_DICDI|nr:hypothetical protein DDB_G0278319 [Dictyostelium discoideum AX4]EAL68332.1 hypothetical protein DDB_G0278319 [Dictyostelium discoideum AX4]|eukprot:XP_642286.1 hypothetical protein DDB_G0278319 [Dictyostelium discoideum AX4]
MLLLRKCIHTKNLIFFFISHIFKNRFPKIWSIFFFLSGKKIKK